MRDGSPDRALVEYVRDRRSSPGSLDLAALAFRARQSGNVVAAPDEQAHDGKPERAGGSGDEDSHVRERARATAAPTRIAAKMVSA